VRAPGAGRCRWSTRARPSGVAPAALSLMMLGRARSASDRQVLSMCRLAPLPHTVSAVNRSSWYASRSISSDASTPSPPSDKPSSRLPKFLLKESIVAPEGYNRYRAALPALATNICGGSVYAWSIFNNPLTRELGVVASCSADWALTDVVPVFSVNAACLGACTFATGKWLEVVGPRAAGAVAATCFSSGLVIGGIGVMYHTLPLVYLGYGFLGGCGAGLSYVSPVSNMSRWFPDKRGLATGAAVMGFGGGAMIAAPLDSYLLSVYSEPPTRLGSIEDLRVVTEDGVRMVDIGGGQMQEVVVATSADVAGTALDVGVYLVGTGNTGVAATFVTVGLLYGGIMAVAASQHRVAPEGYVPPGYTPPKEEVEAAKKFVHIDDSLKTPQFWCASVLPAKSMLVPLRIRSLYAHGLFVNSIEWFRMLWSVVCLNGIAGVSVLSTGKDIMMDIFGNAPASATMVTGGFAASYVMGLSAMNMAGRMGWGGVSDYLGRKQTYMLFGCFAPIAVAMPTLTTMAANGDNGLMPLATFAGESSICAMRGQRYAVRSQTHAVAFCCRIDDACDVVLRRSLWLHARQSSRTRNQRDISSVMCR
jgi:hypothetical protein